MKKSKTGDSSLKTVNTKSIKWERSKNLIFVYAIMLLLMIAAQIIQPGFMSFGHLENVARQVSFLGFVCIGQTLIILIGGIDLSVAATLTLTNVVASQLMNGKDENTLMALGVVLLIGAVAGFMCGTGVHYLRIPPMVMTLAMGSVLQGVAFIYSQGAPKGYRSDMLNNFVNGKVLGLTYGPTLVWIILAAAIILLLRYTTYGRSIYLLGTNREAARYSGISISRVTVSVYMIQFIITALAGFILVGFTGTGYMSTGEPYGIASIAAVVIGGTSVLGGKGGYAGTIAGVVIMSIITSFMAMMNMTQAGKDVVQGLLIILLLIVVYRRKN